MKTLGDRQSSTQEHAGNLASSLAPLSLIICTFLKHSNLTLIHFLKTKHQFTFYGDGLRTQLHFLVNSIVK